MIREKTFYRAFFALALSLALQNLLTFGVNMMDTVMLGRYSQDAMSGVSLCNQIQFLLQMLVARNPLLSLPCLFHVSFSGSALRLKTCSSQIF